MYRFTTIFFVLTCLFYSLNAQIFPEEGSKLNYRIVGFSFPATAGGSQYKIEIATGNYDSENSFKKNIVKIISGDTNNIIGEVPAFGKEYTWRVVGTGDKAKRERNGELHHFSTGIIAQVDTNITRLRITKPAKAYKDGYVFVDGSRALYDMEGNPVWYLPDFDSLVKKGSYVRDIKATAYGTITCIVSDGIYELDYDGRVLWQMPHNKRKRNDSNEFFHHEFTRLSNGHYMTLGRDTVAWRRGRGDSAFVLAQAGHVRAKGDGMEQQPMEFGTVIEYDKAGHVVWAWHSLDYFKQSDLYFWRGDGGMKTRITDVHLNSFYYDEQERMIYLSFKGIDRILKVRYPDGIVVGSYGPEFKPHADADTDLLFCGQHCVKVASNGDLYLYNNNDCSNGGIPTIERLRQPGNDGRKYPELIWEYDCGIDSAFASPKNMLRNLRQSVGGSVAELPDSSYLVCAPTAQDEVFIINRGKEVLWSAEPEKTDIEDKTVSKIYVYRVSMITRKELERLIWDSEKG